MGNCARSAKGMPRTRILFVLAIGVFSLLMYQAHPTPTHDYIFATHGVVKTNDDTPIQGAEIALELDGQVYKGVELIKTVKSATDHNGEFSFVYMSHKRGVKYRISISKEGFDSQMLSGSSPPASNHIVHLKKTRISGHLGSSSNYLGG
jgi:hypothetical protein